MSCQISWTPLADSHLLQMRASGLAWPTVARHLRVGRNAAIERARRLGLLPATRLPPPPAAPAQPRIDRPALPAGHPLTWGAITDGTALQGCAYPHPVFA